MLRQRIHVLALGWYDLNDNGELSSRIGRCESDTALMRMGSYQTKSGETARVGTTKQIGN